jgi:hypothetical protein
MERRFHIPRRVQAQGAANEGEVTRLERVLFNAIRRAVDAVAGTSAEIMTADFAVEAGTHEHVAESVQ